MSYAFQWWSEAYCGLVGYGDFGGRKRKVPYDLIRGYVDAFEVLLWIGIAQAYLA